MREVEIEAAAQMLRNGVSRDLSNPGSELDILRSREMARAILALTDGAPAEWREMSSAPEDTAVLVYADFHYEIAHFNTALKGWVTCANHDRLDKVSGWMPLLEPPKE